MTKVGGRRGRGYGRSAVALHREGYYGPVRPAVNVKVYGWFNTVDYDELRRVNGTGTGPGEVPAWFDWEWIEKNVSEESQREAWGAALEQGWEQLQSDAEECFRSVPGTRRRVQNQRGPKGSPLWEPGVRVWSEGRSGGWAIVEGLPEPLSAATKRWQRDRRRAALEALPDPGSLEWVPGLVDNPPLVHWARGQSWRFVDFGGRGRG